MNSGLTLLLAFSIGIVAGLRSMTAPAVVAWAAHLGWINLSGSHLAFMGSTWAVAILTLGALFEFVADQLPATPARTAAVPLAARIVMGLLRVPAWVPLGVCPFYWGRYSARLAQLRGRSAVIVLASDWFEPLALRILQLPSPRI